MLEDYLRHLASDSPVLALAIPHWGEAMVGCFAFEAKVRLLAGKFFLGESIKREIGGPKDGLLTLLFEKLAFTDDEQKLLRLCNKLRNKLIHCEPDAVQTLVTEIVPTFRPRATMLRFRVPEEALTASFLQDSVEHPSGGVRVVDTISRQDGFIGWLLQAGSDGTFEVAAHIFQVATDIVSTKVKAKAKP